MKRFYLTAKIPETAEQQEQLPADISHALASHQQQVDQRANIPPHIKPNPLIKYASKKWSQTRQMGPPQPLAPPQAVPIAAQEVEDDDYIEEAILQLPKNAQARGRRLALHLHNYHSHKKDFANLLYDLTTRSKRIRTQDRNLLCNVLDSLHRDPNVHPNDFIDKLPSSMDDASTISPLSWE